MTRPDLVQLNSVQFSIPFPLFVSSHLLCSLFAPLCSNGCLNSRYRHDVGQLLAGRIQFNYSCKWVRCFDYHLLKHFLYNFLRGRGAQSFPDPTFKLNKYHSTFRYSFVLYCTFWINAAQYAGLQSIAIQSFNRRDECHLAEPV